MRTLKSGTTLETQVCVACVSLARKWKNEFFKLSQPYCEDGNEQGTEICYVHDGYSESKNTYVSIRHLVSKLLHVEADTGAAKQELAEFPHVATKKVGCFPGVPHQLPGNCHLHRV